MKVRHKYYPNDPTMFEVHSVKADGLGMEFYSFQGKRGFWPASDYESVKEPTFRDVTEECEAEMDRFVEKREP